MKIYNTLTRQVDELKPLEDSNLRMYTCGPTVYDNIHIGNLSSFIFADTLRRVITSTGLNVIHVMNFTDVDDKTIGRSQEVYPGLKPMDALLKITDGYRLAFLHDMQAVGSDVEAITFIKATDSIEAMQQLVKELLDASIAYVADDGIYFSIEAYKTAGKTYGQLADITIDSTSEARIQNDEYDKESAHDFALWKKQKVGEPAWDFKIKGQDLCGRPGWHLECSAMSRITLGQPFDIHTGGVDLIFPHHENEIAQSTASKASSDYATYFAHNEHLLVDGKKMSKSLDNFYTLKDIEGKGFDPIAFRLLTLQAHYRKQAHFSWENLEAANKRLNNYQALADLRFQASTQSNEEPGLLSDLKVYGQQVRQAMEEDLNTPKALAIISGVVDEITSKLDTDDLDELVEFLILVDALMGLNLLVSSDISDDQKLLITERQQARESNNWVKSDQLRDQLIGQGIGVRDTSSGPIWFRL